MPPVKTSFQSFFNDQASESLTLKLTTVEELSGICIYVHEVWKALRYDADISMYVIKNTFEIVSDRNLLSILLIYPFPKECFRTSYNCQSGSCI